MTTLLPSGSLMARPILTTAAVLGSLLAALASPAAAQVDPGAGAAAYPLPDSLQFGAVGPAAPGPRSRPDPPAGEPDQLLAEPTGESMVEPTVEPVGARIADASPAGPNAPVEVVTVPFGSVGHAVEIDVANESATAELAGASVAVASGPAWLRFDATEVTLADLAPGTGAVAALAFAVDRTAPVGVPANVAVEVRVGRTVVAVRTFRFAVAAPREVSLGAPRPNPTRGAAGLTYELPVAGRVDVRMYDVLGREVAQLVGEEKTAGRHEARIASGLAAGVYVVRLVASGPGGETQARTQRFTVVR